MGYMPISALDSPQPMRIHAVSSADLDEKRIWHVVLPSTVMSDMLQPIPLKSVLNGDPVASIGSVEFGFRKNTDKAQQRGFVFTKAKKQDTFRAVSRYKVNTKRLEQLVQLPTVRLRENGHSTSAPPPFKAKCSLPQQPGGFKFKCSPIGVLDKSRRHAGATARIPVPTGISLTKDGSPSASKRKASRLESSHRDHQTPQKRARRADG